MKLLLESVMFLLPTLVLSYNPFKSEARSPSVVKGQEPSGHRPDSFNPDDLLAPRSPKPEIYTKAMFELKRLEEEPLCHRIAAQMLMNNCESLEDVNENNYQLNSIHLQRHHVESFAASLAICDLERGRFSIPYTCQPFTSSVLLRMFHERKGKLETSPEQVGACLEALGQDHSHWNTWLSYRDKALLFCKAARIDIDKGITTNNHQLLPSHLE